MSQGAIYFQLTQVSHQMRTAGKILYHWFYYLAYNINVVIILMGNLYTTTLEEAPNQVLASYFFILFTNIYYQYHVIFC